MSTTPVTPAAAPAAAPSGWSRFETIAGEVLNYAEVITAVAASVPNPAQPFAAPVLIIENMLSGLLKTHMAVTGKTADEILKGLPDLKPIP